MAPLTWGRQVEHALIDLVRDQPPLWQTSHPNYTKKNLKRELYRQIADTLQAMYPEIHDITPENIQTKYSNLRTSFKRELKKIREVKSGSDGRDELKDSQWPMFDSMLFLLDVVEPSPNISTNSFDSQVARSSEEDLFFSTLDPGYADQSQDVVRIRDREGTTSPATASTPSPSQSVLTPSFASSSTPSPASASQFLLPQIPAPSLASASQPPPSASLKQTPLRKRKLEKGSEPASTNTQKILGAMANAISDLNTSKGIPSCCGILVEKTCEKLSFLNQLRLLGKLTKIMEEELMEAGVSVEPM